jgi:hypothetical protein
MAAQNTFRNPASDLISNLTITMQDNETGLETFFLLQAQQPSMFDQSK